MVALFRGGRGVGFPIAGTTISALALVIGGLWFFLMMGVSKGIDDATKANNTADKTAGSSDSSSTKDKPAPPASADAKDHEWTDAHKRLVQGDVRVGVASAVIDLVDIEDLGQSTTSKDKLLIVRLDVDNLSRTRKVDFSGWGNAGRIFNPNTAELTDGLGNSYKRINFGFATKIVGQAENETIYPGKTAQDVLVFEPPVDSAPFVHLELPAAAFGGTGKLRFQIPRAVFGPNKIETNRPQPVEAAKDEAAEEARKAAAEKVRKEAAEQARKAAVAAAVKSLDAMKAGDSPTDAVAYLSDDDKDVHAAALSALKRIGQAAVSALAKSLGKKDVATRLQAAKTLGEIGPDAKEAAFAIQVWMRSENDPEVKQAEMEALEKINAKR